VPQNCDLHSEDSTKIEHQSFTPDAPDFDRDRRTSIFNSWAGLKSQNLEVVGSPDESPHKIYRKNILKLDPPGK
jgi:hypothetical protein